MRIVLALDFDGVLHPCAPRGEPFSRLALLQDWLREHECVDVLISSSWREFHALDEMVSYFDEDLRDRIVGITPMAHRLYGPRWMRTPQELEACRFERQHEIQHWIDRHRPGFRWLALDDDATLFEPGCTQLVVANPVTGIHPGTLFELDQLLATLSASPSPGVPDER